MNDLGRGILEMEGISLKPKYKLGDLIKALPSDKIKILNLDEATMVVRFLMPIKIGSKKFYVRINFDNNYLSGIELKISDLNIDEWDYKSMLGQHGDWLTEQIGYPNGILSVNEFAWGKITQWDDPRSCDAGIRISYL